jgi:putrescine:ornithine antiporter
VIGTVYSFYALYASGEEAMMLGALTTFAGWSFWGIFIDKQDKHTLINK